ncbi:hypothetical protein DC094_13490 [Pelagibaculum spongiae]|uniref:Uncharacterized protein n=1 Tax=Pelagibaculum spongiae TaxID=2080658 RepID=A0A2V1GZ13_9GAMM|nr:hypothetical protein DC094_13490 [Pelagibaculum spongiae]
MAAKQLIASRYSISVVVTHFSITAQSNFELRRCINPETKIHLIRLTAIARYADSINKNFSQPFEIKALNY